MRPWRSIVVLLSSSALAAVGLAAAPAGAATVAASAAPAAAVRTDPTVAAAARYDTSRPLREVAAEAAARGPSALTTAPTRTPVTNKPNPAGRLAAMKAQNPPAPTFPNPTGPSAGLTMPATGEGFEGIPNQAGYYPPDTDGDVGPNHYVQVVNSNVAMYDKQTGLPVAGPMMISTVFSGFGGECERYNDGDPIVQYDRQADRWLISQFAVTGSETGGLNYECVAISTTGDPTGSYHRYAFSYVDFPDYPKFGVWPDGYYVTYNMFDSTTFDYLGAKSCALDRTAMLAGDPATQVCFDSQYPGPTPEWSLLPSDLDGQTAPPAGAPNYLVGLHWEDFDKLTMYRFHVDFASPQASTFEGPIYLDVNPFVWACYEENRGQCVQQPDTAVKLESLGDRAMFRLAYRNFGTHESLVFTHTTGLDASLGVNQTGLAWYEIRTPDATPTVYQNGTSADPAGNVFRFMGSVAMDRQGNMALGYSVASATRYPSIAYVGRLAGDPLSTMPYGENVIMAGTGSQTGTAARWGDYSSMEVDPVDDCTFWYTNQYLSTTSMKSWRTRIASFVFPSCQVPGEPTGISAVPTATTAAVSWTAPTWVGASPITSYTAMASPTTARAASQAQDRSFQEGPSCTVAAPASTCTITGLEPGSLYDLHVSATNAYGPGAWSSSAQVTTLKGGQTITFTSTAPTGARVGGSGYTVRATGGASGAPVVFGTTTSAVCRVAGAKVTFRGVGTCTVTANQAGTSQYTAAPQVTQSFRVRAALVAQVPLRPLQLPRTVRSSGWTRLIAAVPVRTNAGQTAKVKVSVKPRTVASVVPRGDAALYRLRTIDGQLYLWLPGTTPSRITVTVWARATGSWTSYQVNAVYTTSRTR